MSRNGMAGAIPPRSLDELGIPVARGAEPLVRRALPHLADVPGETPGIGVTDRFRRVIDDFAVPEGETPAGFRVELLRSRDGTVHVDLVRDIGRDRNGVPRPTPLIFSVDSADPYEVEPFAGLIGNLTCNPGIVYDLFINNPAANVDHRFDTLEAVLEELGRILGPGCDVSVELNNPFEPDFSRLLEQIQTYESILTPHRLVVKVPHTGPVNARNVRQLLDGDGRLDVRYDQGATADYLRGHQLALKLHEHGYRVNFTLMFAPHQTALALQARPYFINAFLRHRQTSTKRLVGLLAAFDATQDRSFLVQLRDYMIANDLLVEADAGMELLEVIERARAILRNRRHEDEGADGLDHARQTLRWLKTTNLPDTRLILCSMEGLLAYPDIMRMLTEPEFGDLHHRVLITTEPNYLARWTSHPQVVSYQRRFMRAARAVNEAPAPSTLATELQETTI